MSLWWHFLLIQMTFSDILGLGSRQEAVGMLPHILSLASSCADDLSWTCCVISQPSYRNQTWLNTSCPQQTAPPFINGLQLHLSFCCDFWNLVLNLDLIRTHCSCSLVSVTSNHTCSWIASRQNSDHEPYLFYLAFNNLSNIMGLVWGESVDVSKTDWMLTTARLIIHTLCHGEFIVALGFTPFVRFGTTNLPIQPDLVVNYASGVAPGTVKSTTEIVQQLLD